MAELIKVSMIEEGTRLLRWFLRRYPSMPQREFYKLCRGGQIRVNSSRAHGQEILREGDIIRVPPTIESYAKTKIKKTESGEAFSLTDLEKLRQCIIHNDEDIVVFNKPAGLAVQGGTGIRKSVDKMAAALFPYDKISLVHRLDKETSGILVVAKNHKAAQFLAGAFQSKSAHKEYLALLNGNVKPKRGIIDNYIVKGQVSDTARRINDGTGQKPQRAITEYQVLTQAGEHIHSALSLRAPIVGDTLYGTEKKLDDTLRSLLSTNNLFLLAYKIIFQHPTTGKIITLKADVPDFMKPVISFLELKLP